MLLASLVIKEGIAIFSIESLRDTFSSGEIFKSLEAEISSGKLSEGRRDFLK